MSPTKLEQAGLNEGELERSFVINQCPLNYRANFIGQEWGQPCCMDQSIEQLRRVSNRGDARGEKCACSSIWEGSDGGGGYLGVMHIRDKMRKYGGSAVWWDRVRYVMRSILWLRIEDRQGRGRPKLIWDQIVRTGMAPFGIDKTLVEDKGQGRLWLVVETVENVIPDRSLY